MNDEAKHLEGRGDIAWNGADIKNALAWYEAASAAEHPSSSLRLKIGRALQTLGRFADAEACYHRLLEEAPGHVGALVGLGNAARSRGDLGTALLRFEAAAANEPDKPAAQIRIAETLAGLHRLDDAEAYYLKVLAQLPKHSAALVGLGETARARGDLESALHRFEAAAANAPNRPMLQVRIAETLVGMHRLDEAEAGYRAALERWPGHAACREGLGDIAQDRGDLATALSWYGAAADAERPSLSVQLKMARVLRELGRLADAEACYETALERVPEHAGALIGLGQTARLRGDFATALTRFRAAAASEPDKPAVRVQIAETLSQLLRFDEAEAAFQSILQAFPDDIRALTGLGSLKLEWGENAAALALFEAAAAKAPTDRGPWFRLVTALRDLCRIDEATAILDRIAGFAEGDDIRLQVQRFKHFCLTLQLAEAEKCLRAWGGHRNVPRDAVARAAELYAALGRWCIALEFFRERVVESEWVGGFDNVFEPVARAARATGRYAEVRELFDRLSSTSADFALRRAGDWITGEMRLLHLLDPRRPEFGKAMDSRPADPFQVERCDLFARVLAGRRAAAQQTEIFTCADSLYLIGASVSLFSLMRHNIDRRRPYRMLVFCADDVHELGSAVFGEIGAALGRPIEVRAAGSLFSNEVGLRTGWGIFTPGQGLSPAAYYRIHAARQLIGEGGASRALYIDADTCVYSGVDELAGFDLAGQPIAARLDETTNPDIRRASIRLGLKPGRYFNSGVLVFDLSHPELAPALDRTMKIALSEQHRLTFVDQCALNLAFRDKFTALPERFNRFVKREPVVDPLPGDATVVHFLARPKPWDPMYDTPNCRPWLREFSALTDILAPDLTRRLLALQFPAIAEAAAAKNRARGRRHRAATGAATRKKTA